MATYGYRFPSPDELDSLGYDAMIDVALNADTMEHFLEAAMRAMEPVSRAAANHDTRALELAWRCWSSVGLCARFSKFVPLSAERSVPREILEPAQLDLAKDLFEALLNEEDPAEVQKGIDRFLDEDAPKRFAELNDAVVAAGGKPLTDPEREHARNMMLGFHLAYFVAGEAEAKKPELYREHRASAFKPIEHDEALAAIRRIGRPDRRGRYDDLLDAPAHKLKGDMLNIRESLVSTLAEEEDARCFEKLVDRFGFPWVAINPALGLSRARKAAKAVGSAFDSLCEKVNMPTEAASLGGLGLRVNEDQGSLAYFAPNPWGGGVLSFSWPPAHVGHEWTHALDDAITCFHNPLRNDNLPKRLRPLDATLKALASAKHVGLGFPGNDSHDSFIRQNEIAERARQRDLLVSALANFGPEEGRQSAREGHIPPALGAALDRLWESPLGLKEALPEDKKAAVSDEELEALLKDSENHHNAVTRFNKPPRFAPEDVQALADAAKAELAPFFPGMDSPGGPGAPAFIAKSILTARHEDAPGRELAAAHPKEGASALWCRAHIGEQNAAIRRAIALRPKRAEDLKEKLSKPEAYWMKPAEILARGAEVALASDAHALASPPTDGSHSRPTLADAGLFKAAFQRLIDSFSADMGLHELLGIRARMGLPPREAPKVVKAASLADLKGALKDRAAHDEADSKGPKTLAELSAWRGAQEQAAPSKPKGPR